MNPERRDHDDDAVIPRLTPGLEYSYDNIDQELFENTGEFLYTETIDMRGIEVRLHSGTLSSRSTS